MLPTLQGMGRIRRGTSADRGAAALEFALVVPLLLLLLFGIIDYGIYFSDGMAGRSAVQNAARQGAVNQCPTLACIAQLTKDQTDSVAGGDEYVKISVVTVPPNGPDWVRGNELTVCSIIKAGGLTGGTEALGAPLELFPNGGTIRNRATFRIEQDALPHPTGTYEDALPAGIGDWSFCP